MVRCNRTTPVHLEEFEAGFRVIAKDRLGWGKSSKALVPYSWSLHASNIAAILDHLSIEQLDR